MSSVLPYFVGAGFSAGLLLFVSALFPAPAPLSTAMERLHRQLPSDNETHGSFVTRIFGTSWAQTSIATTVLRGVDADLRLCNMTSSEYLAQRAVCAVVAMMWAPFTVLLMSLLGVAVPLVVPVWAALLLAPIGFIYPALALRSKARARRRAFRHAFSSFLDIVSISLAGGKGVEGALDDASNAGDGWVFERLRGALLEARLLRVTPWHCLAVLGEQLDITELRELAASASLAGDEGARVRSSISAKAKALRQHSLADVESAAQSASERMSLPIVILIVGFVVFLGYPAIMAVVQGI